MSKIRFDCPKMQVNAVSHDLKQTTEIECPCTLTLDDGTEIKGSVTFPPTYIDRDGLLRWTVRECTANGFMSEGQVSPISVTLLEEQVIGPYAKAVECSGRLLTSYGYMTFGGWWPGVFSIPIEDGEWLVLPVNATFDIVLT